MISRIDHIRDFGIFRDFRWDGELPEYSQFNLIYGWNYSGKTTLSRVFQAMEEKAIPEEHPAGQFAATLEDGSRIESTNLVSAPRICVFNRNYVRKNFREEHTAPAVFIVGEENIALRSRLNLLSRRRARVDSLLSEFTERRDAIRTTLDHAKTDKARDIGNQLGTSRYFRRPNLDQRIEEIRSNPESHIINDEAVVAARLQTAIGAEQYSVLPAIQMSIPDLVQSTNEVNELLERTASNMAIARLKEDVTIEDWVREGLSIHSDSVSCEFCGNSLTERRLTELRGHFSDEYEKLVAGLREKQTGLSSSVPPPLTLDQRNLMPEQRARFSAAKSNLVAWLEWVAGVREQLVQALTTKQTRIETETRWQGDLTSAGVGTNILKDLNQAIDQHNRAVERMDETRSKAREDLERHYASLFFRDGRVAASESSIVELEKKTARAGLVLEQIRTAIGEVEAKIKQSSIGATKLNSLIKYLLGDSNIEVVPLDNATFRFTRGTQPATHLSEGEKTALTFAYFATSLEGGGSRIEQTIAFIDDPISSLDSNHIYAVFALIVERLAKAHQLFVSTHNSELLNLLKASWLDPRRGFANTGHARAYYLAREVGHDGEAHSVLLDLPHLLRAYKSEYEFIFSRLRSFSESEVPTLHEAYSAANLLRKFLEAYLGFRRAVPRAWWQKLDLLFDEEEVCREIRKFADDGSHLQVMDRALDHSDLAANSQRCVRIVLEALQFKDPEHHAALVDAVAGGLQ